MSVTKDQIAAAVASVRCGGRGTLGELSAVGRVATCDGHSSIKLLLPADANRAEFEQVAREAHGAVDRLARGEGERVVSLIVEFVNEGGAVVHTARTGAGGAAGASAGASAEQERSPSPGPLPRGGGGKALNQPQAQAHSLPGIRQIVAVGAGKGGVGKSTIAVNLAVGLARRGHAVGLLDGDIYGPSIPTLLGLAAAEQSTVAGKLQPFYVHGIKAITIGKLVEPDKPLIWRGPMAHGAFKQLAEQTQWGELDYLVIDLPPGTGDVSLTMAQMLRLAGAVIVCTPQRVAQDDAVRAARMFAQLGIDVLGVVENMSTFIADDLEPPREYDLFGKGGAERMAGRLGVPFLGAVPITAALRINSDGGDPSANFGPGPGGRATALAAALESVVKNVETQLALAGARGPAGPTLAIS